MLPVALQVKGAPERGKTHKAPHLTSYYFL